MAILPILALLLMVGMGFAYTTAMYIYAFRLVFSTILPCI